MDTIIWTIGWPVAVDFCDFLTVKTQILQGEYPTGITKESKGVNNKFANHKVAILGCYVMWRESTIVCRILVS